MTTSGKAVMQTPLGSLQITADDGLISSILFADEPMETTLSTHPLLKLAVAELQAYFAGALTSFSLATAQKGTPFQQRVWQQLQGVPYGHTQSYKQLALALGNEKCIRAAGAANGKNQLAIVVPCHRIIGSSGQLVGYAGGLWRKQWLLQHEAANSGKPVQTQLFG